MFKRQIQLSILLENKPGRLGEVCDTLYERGVDIQALSVTPFAESGILRMVVDDPDAAEHGLREHNIPCLRAVVLVAHVPNQPGMAAGLGHRFSQAGLNIEYAYFTGGEPGTQATMVFKVTDTDRALALLNRQADEFN